MHARTRGMSRVGRGRLRWRGGRDADRQPRALSPYGERDRLVREIATTSYPKVGTTQGGKSLTVNQCHWRRTEGATDGPWWRPRAPPQGCWNVRGRRFDGTITYHGATSTAGQAGRCCSTACCRRDDRAPAARELQLIREAQRRDGLARLDRLPRRVRAATPSSAREPISLPLTRRTASGA
jgi:hypothetical protein